MNAPLEDEIRAPGTIADVVAAGARRAPSAPAILAPGRSPLTYHGLQLEVERTLAALGAAGVGRGTRVALAVPNGPEAAVAMLAVVCGATCVPLNPDLDPSTCDLLLRKLRVDALIAPDGADSPAVAVARALELQLLRLAPRPRDAAGAFDLSTAAPRPAIAPTNPVPADIAIVFHTSGTTSAPKVVPLTQSQLLARSAAQPIDDRDRCLYTQPVFTSSAVHTLLAPLAAGASIAFPRSHDAAAVLEALGELAITYFPTSPAVLASLLDRLDGTAFSRPTALRFVRSSSSALPPALQERLEAALGVPVIQGFGMTEVGPVAQNPLPPARRKAGSVGLTVGPGLAIVDEQRTLVGRGTVGEIVVRGPGVMSGYEGDPEATRSAFHDSWFRTGDSGYLDEDGYLFITGRIKELVNRGGMKVSPAEVDEALLRHPAVLDAATFGVPHPTLGEDVAAAVVLRRDATLTPGQLREFAFAHLAAYKVPSKVAIVASLPRNAAGKLNPSTLAQGLKDASRPTYIAPRNEREKVVAAIFAEVLRLERVGADDNFFALGGDSLRGTQVIARANCALEASIGAESLFRWPTVADFAAFAVAEGPSKQVRPRLAPRASAMGETRTPPGE